MYTLYIYIAAASMRSKAHRLQHHEYTTKETIKATARKLLTTHGGYVYTCHMFAACV